MEKKVNTRKDPFYEPPLHKAFYHPSKEKKVSDKRKKSSLLRGAYQNEEAQKEEKRDTGTKAFLKGSNTYRKKEALPTETGSPGNNSELFDESWPTSERPSTIDIPDVTDSVDTSVLSARYLEKMDMVRSKLSYDGTQDDQQSTLSKYMERFRHSKPMSREEREKHKVVNERDFWWLQHGGPEPSDSSTPKSERSASRLSKPQQSDASRQKSIKEKMDISSVHDPSEEKTHRLQERAEQLLEKTESSMNSSDPMISTTGLGSEPSPSTVDEEPYRPHFVSWRSADKENLPFRSTFSRPLRPEDDILQQWRMRRKLELAKERMAAIALGGPEIPQSSKVPDPAGDSLAAFRDRLSRAARGEPVPETIVTSVPDLDSAESALPSTSRLLASDIQFTPAPQRQQNIQTHQPTQQSHATPPVSPHSSQQASPIASPSMSRKHTTVTTTTVEPHLHLSCDILPCPHNAWQHHHHHVTETIEGEPKHTHPSDHPHPLSGQHPRCKYCYQESVCHKHHHGETTKVHKGDYVKSDFDKGPSHGETTQINKGDPVKSDFDKEIDLRKIEEKYVETESDSDFEKLKRDHMQTVEREMSESVASEETDRSTKIRPGEEVFSRDKEPRHHRSRYDDELNKYEIPERDTDNRSSAEFSDRKLVKPERKSSKSRDRKQKQQAKSRADSDSEVEITTAKFPHPKPAAASTPVPRRPGVKSAIGEVVREHLFVGMSVGSSADWEDVRSGKVSQQQQDQERLHQQQQQIPTGQEAQTDNDFNDFEYLVPSDGEEYPDDEILMDLRKRRQAYIKRLKEIETALEELPTN